MTKLLKWVLTLLIIYAAYNFFIKEREDTAINTVSEEIENSINQESITSFIQTLTRELNGLKSIFQDAQDFLPDWNVEKHSADIPKPVLETPKDYPFSIYNISLGDEQQKVEKSLGAPQRVTENEYGISWITYHNNYHNFVMIGYDDNNKVAALYTNQDLIASSYGIKKGTKKEQVLDTLGEPLTELRKGLVSYKMAEDRDYEMFALEDSYVTVFFDKHENNTVTALQIISSSLEDNRKDFYVDGTENLKEGFEYQLFDLTNASRVNNNLNPLTWDEAVRETARKHSLDMAENNYFSHTNLEGESPFDRMLNDGIHYSMAGENLAYGQNSSVFAHEGLMNSMGHRENILQKDFASLGVGVAFNNDAQPYYTENFLTK
ncbi:MULTISPECIES: CAP-associated domain-containing protein [Bacillaceae]|uniref:CAP domain-containing protein n=1 Tax=Bacillaceae TaxID=186817 RepID=UPI0004E0BF7A|nr:MULTISPECIES: CAP-associated domain-containing protein [Bacillaceae]MCM3364156.1 CAP domain-containing protein [Niallia sp. MER TA 168]